MLKIYVDSDGDFTKKEADELGVEFISMPYTVNEKDIYPYVDWEEFDDHDFYEKMRSQGLMPKTFALNQYNYRNIFEKEYQAGNDVFYIHLSRNMTTSINEVDACFEELEKEYKGRHHYLVDTRAIVTLQYIISRAVIDKLHEGMDPKEAEKWGNEEAFHYCIYFYADNLNHFARSGRVSGMAALMGNLIGLHPIVHMCNEGRMEACDKVRGKRNALKSIIDKMVEYGDDLANHRIVIGHTDAPRLVEELVAMIKEQFGDNLDIIIKPANPTAGSHCGPDGVGVAFHCKQRLS